MQIKFHVPNIKSYICCQLSCHISVHKDVGQVILTIKLTHKDESTTISFKKLSPNMWEKKYPHVADGAKSAVHVP